MQSDLDLIENIRKGRLDAFEQLVKRHQSFAFGVAQGILGHAMEAEEATMDAFLKVYRHLNRFEGNSKFTTWLYRIVSNEALTRKRKKKVNFTDLSGASDTSDTVKHIQGQDRHLIRRCVTELDPVDAQLITLYYLQDIDLAEISELLDLSTSNAKVRLHRARKKLASLLQKKLGDEAKELLNYG